jgi:hypothetical protein
MKTPPKTLAGIGSEMAGLLSEIHKSPSRYAAWIRTCHDIEIMRIDQPKAPRSAKRQTDDHQAIRAGIWATVNPFMRDETIDPLITKALASGTITEVLKAISKGAGMVKDKSPLSSFARHVIVALTVALHFMENKNTIPTKESVRKKAEKIFESKKWGGFQTEISRWTEILKAAGLSELPDERRPRGKAKHGDAYTEGRKNPKSSPSVLVNEIEVNLNKKR